MNLLKADDEHRAIRFPKDGFTYLDHIVGPDRKEEPIERRVMQLAECYAIAHNWLALEIAVRGYVRRVEELLVPQPT